MTVNLPRDAEEACRALWELGDSVTSVRLSQALPALLAVPADRKQILDYAERQGWIIRANRRIELTGKGQQRFSPYLRPREESPGTQIKPAYTVPLKTLESVLSRLPMQHRLFVTLLSDTIVARRHLALSRNEPWPGHIAIGGSGTGKTTMHRLICRLFEFDPVPCTVNLTQAHTRGALKGTVITGHGFMPSPYMRLPYLAFEEVDKEKSLVSLVDPYFLGEISHETRGQPYHIFPAPAIFANPPDDSKDRYSLVHPAWRRRSVFLDTQFMSPREKEQIEDFADWLDSPGNLSPGLLQLDSFTVPGRLSDAGKAMLQCVRELLSPGFRNLDLYCGTGPLELITLGHIAVYGMSHEVAAWHIGLCYLGIGSTVAGELTPDALTVWERLYPLAGSDLASLRKALRSAKSSAETARESAEIERQISPEDAMLARMQESKRKLQALNRCGKWIRFFDPDRFYDDTSFDHEGETYYHYDITEQIRDDFQIMHGEINQAKDSDTLTTAITLFNRLAAYARPFVGYLQAEFDRIRQEESEPDSQEDDYGEPVRAEIISEPEIPDCIRCTMPAIVFAKVRHINGGMPARLALCTSHYLAYQSARDLITEIIERYPTFDRERLAINPGPASMISDRVGLEIKPARQLAISPNSVSPGSAGSQIVWCAFSHMIPRIAALHIIGSPYPFHAANTRYENSVPCCNKCKSKAYEYLRSSGMTYIKETSR